MKSYFVNAMLLNQNSEIHYFEHDVLTDNVHTECKLMVSILQPPVLQSSDLHSSFSDGSFHISDS